MEEIKSDNTDTPIVPETPMTLEEQTADSLLKLESTGSSVNFRVDPLFMFSEDPEDLIHKKILTDEVHIIIQNSIFKNYNKEDENGNLIKLNKVQINKVYSHVVDNINRGYKKIEIWAVLSEYFDIYPNKFYSSLSNIYKHELILELDELTGILDKKRIKKLF